MQTGVSTACFFGSDTVEESVEILGKMGVKLIEVFLNTFSEYDAAYVKALKERVDDYGIKVHSVHPHGVQFEPQLFSLYKRSQQDAQDIFRRVQEAAALLEADMTVFHGCIALKKNLKKPNMARAGGIVDGLAEIARSFGVKLAYENVHWCWYRYPGFAKELLQNVKSDNLYFTLDVKQAMQSGYGFEKYIEDMSGRICNLHICDYVDKEGLGYTTIPPKGELDAALLKKNLQNSGYTGPAILEVYRDNFSDMAEFEEAYARFQQLFA